MAYVATLINRLEQFGKVTYDLVVDDDANVMPTQRQSVKWTSAQDTQARRNAVLAAAPQVALDRLRDAEIEVNIANAIDQKDPTFVYCTVAETIAVLKDRYAQMSGWPAVCIGNYISSRNFANAQYTNLFGYSGAALTAFKAKLANAVTKYNSVISEQGGN